MNELPVHRLYLDEDVPVSAAQIGRRLGLDVIAAAEAGPIPRPDPEHLAAAAMAGRALVTYNRNDYLRCTRDFFAMARPHRGVLILTRKLPRQGVPVAHALERWAAARTLAMQNYEVEFLSK